MTATNLELDPSTPLSDQQRSARPHDARLSIPRKLWSAPVNEAQWCRTRPRLSPRLLLAPVAAPVAAYISAACATRGHMNAAGWLLSMAVLAIVSGVAAVAVHGRRVVRYRAEAPREEFR